MARVINAVLVTCNNIVLISLHTYVIAFTYIKSFSQPPTLSRQTTTYCAFTIAQYVHSIAQSGVQTGWTQAVVLLVLSIHILSGEKSRVAFIHIHVHNLLFFPIYVSITHADHMLLHKYSCMHQQTVLHVLGSALYTYVCTS